MVAIIDRKRQKPGEFCERVFAKHRANGIPVDGLRKRHADLACPPISTANRMHDPVGFRNFKKNFPKSMGPKGL
jgi:hypothetical protein